MRKFIYLIIFFIIQLQYLYPQSYAGYWFLYTPYGGYTEFSDGILSTATGDDGAEDINLPFPFKYMGIEYTTARISVNGWLEMGQTYTGTGAANQIESTVMKPFLCPLWDNLYDDSQSEISYKVTGEYPARFFIIQWRNMKWAYNNNRKSFQIKLWEIDNTIDFEYGPGSTVNLTSYSVGINNHIGGSGNFVSITPASLFNHPPVVSATIPQNNNENLALLEDGLIYTFTTIPSFGYGYARVYQSPDSVQAGAANQEILAVIVPTHSGDVLTPPWITGFEFTTYGTTNQNDILSARLYKTGSSPYFATTYLVGTAFPDSTGKLIFPGSGVTNNNKLNYMWLAYDIDANAVNGNLVDGNCTKIIREGCCPSIIPDSSYAGASLIIFGGTPVELVNFSAAVINSSVELNWETRSELNNSGFEVQRKTAESEWQSLTFIKGAGTTAESQSYNFTDRNPGEETCYYRLKQIDSDGSFVYSDIIEVQVKHLASFSLNQNYPNPFNPLTMISYNIIEAGRVNLKIYRIDGQLVRTLVNNYQQSGYYESAWDGKNDSGELLSTGIYFYRLSVNSFTQAKKMILLR